MTSYRRFNWLMWGCFLSLSAMFFGCGGQKISFSVLSPAKYPESMKIKTIEVKPFTLEAAKGSLSASFLKQLIENEIIGHNHISVVDKGAQTVLTGYLHFSPVTEETYEDDSPPILSSLISKALDDGEEDKTRFVLKKSLSVSGSYSLNLLAENRRLFGEPIEFVYQDQWSSTNNIKEAVAKAPSNDQILAAAMSKIASDIARSVSPHQKKVTRRLETGEDERLKLGGTYLIHGRTEQAVSLWDQVISESQEESDIAKAYYNIGVVLEVQGKYADAFANYSEASMRDIGNERYLEAMSRVETAKIEKEKTDIQIQ